MGQTRTALCSIPLDSGKSWLNWALKRAIFSILAQRNKRRRPGYRDCHIYLIALLDLSTKLGIQALFLHFLLESLWSRGWRSDPTSVLPIGMPLSPITRATVVIFSELGFACLFTVCHLLIVFFSVTLGEETQIFVPLTFTERGKQIQTCLISVDGNPSLGKMATSEKITSIGRMSAHITER